MRKNETIPIHEYSYELPDNRIAKYPLSERDASKLLEYRTGMIKETIFKNLKDLLPEDSLLFINNTQVIHARLLFRRPTGASIEVFCLSPYDPSDYQLAFTSTHNSTWKCMVGNLKKWKDEKLETPLEINHKKFNLTAEKIGMESNEVIVHFSWNNEVTFAEVIDTAGSVPIPPYLNRNAEVIDNERYQTVYSKYRGSVAAPTAGFHFTPGILDQLKTKNIHLKEITLHVGAGTFQPVKSNNVLEHKMHPEFFSIGIENLKALASTKKNIIATGTTTLRTLESLYWLAVKSVREQKVVTSLGQWDHYNLIAELSFQEAISELIILMLKQNLKVFSAETGIMIVPGYTFQVVDLLITNFHQPQSTLLLLVAAFIGNAWKKVYDYALEHDFRFLSYGDSSLLWKF